MNACHALDIIARKDGLYATYVFVIDQLHELEFSVGPLRVCYILEGSRQLLNRHILRSDGIVRRAVTYQTKFKIDLLSNNAFDRVIIKNFNS